jgi:hypothetical protein
MEHQHAQGIAHALPEAGNGLGLQADRPGRLAQQQIVDRSRRLQLGQVTHRRARALVGRELPGAAGADHQVSLDSLCLAGLELLIQVIHQECVNVLAVHLSPGRLRPTSLSFPAH